MQLQIDLALHQALPHAHALAAGHHGGLCGDFAGIAGCVGVGDVVRDQCQLPVDVGQAGIGDRDGGIKAHNALLLPCKRDQRRRPVGPWKRSSAFHIKGFPQQLIGSGDELGVRGIGALCHDKLAEFLTDIDIRLLDGAGDDSARAVRAGTLDQRVA